jgi:hypothetical protein
MPLLAAFAGDQGEASLQEPTARVVLQLGADEVGQQRERAPAKPCSAAENRVCRFSRTTLCKVPCSERRRSYPGGLPPGQMTSGDWASGSAGLVDTHHGSRPTSPDGCSVSDSRTGQAPLRRVAQSYAAGEDVNSKLPALSTYRGHVSVENTRLCLVANGALLQAGSVRFAHGIFALDGVQP